MASWSRRGDGWYSRLPTRRPARRASGPFSKPAEVTALPNGLKVITVPWAQPGHRRLLHARSRGLPRRGREGPQRLRPLLRAHDVPRHGAASRRRSTTSASKRWAPTPTPTPPRTARSTPSSAPSQRARRRSMELEADRFQHLKYNEDGVPHRGPAPCSASTTRARRAPSCRCGRSCATWRSQKHTYRHTTIGFLADIKAMPDKYDYAQGVLQALLHARQHHRRRGGRRVPRGLGRNSSRSAMAAGRVPGTSQRFPWSRARKGPCATSGVGRHVVAADVDRLSRAAFEGDGTEAKCDAA